MMLLYSIYLIPRSEIFYRPG